MGAGYTSPASLHTILSIEHMLSICYMSCCVVSATHILLTCPLTRDLTRSAPEIAKQTATDAAEAISEAARRLREQALEPLRKGGLRGITGQVKKVIIFFVVVVFFFFAPDADDYDI